MANRTRAVATAIVILASGLATAAEPTVGDLSQVQGETVLLKAKAARAAAQAELDARQKAAGNVSVEAEAPAPVVTSVEGEGERLHAAFLYGSGAVATGTVGDRLPGGFVVESISVDRVALRRGKTLVMAAFSASTLPSMRPSMPNIPATSPGGFTPYMPPPPLAR